MDRNRLVESLFELFRGGIGFSLVVGGVTFFLLPVQDRARRYLGLLFAAVGFLFCFSALDLQAWIPEAVYNFLIIAALLAQSQALFEITLYLFGDERRPALVRPVLLAGIAWSLLIWFLPFLDYLMGWNTLRRSIEDGAGMGPLHTAASIAIYVWPIAISVLAVRAGRSSLRDIPGHAPGVKTLVYGAVALVIILCVILLGAILASVALYRAGHTALELLTLLSYFFVVARPDLFVRARREIREEQEKNLKLSDGEAQAIGERIAWVAANTRALYRAGMNLRSFAGVIKVPPYRLSLYFNGRIKTSFSVWLNARRIEYVCRQMLDHPDRSILEISLAAGYGSRSVFNKQFLRIVGMTPSEYRRSAGGKRPPR